MKFLVVEEKHISKPKVLAAIRDAYGGDVTELFLKYKRGRLSVYFPKADLSEKEALQIARNMHMQARYASDSLKKRMILSYQ